MLASHPIRFFSLQGSSAPLLRHWIIDELFSEFPLSERCTLIQTILTNEYERAEQSREEDRLADIIANIPHEWTETAKLAYLNDLLTRYHASPVLTAHPTRVISNEAIYIIDHITATLIASTNHQRSSHETIALKKHLKEAITLLLDHSILPSGNLTPQQEAKFANYVYKNILDAYPEFLKRVVDQFVKVHGGNEVFIKQQLKTSVMLSFQHVWSWVIADLDGNPKKTAKTMEGMIRALQRTIINLYLKRIEPLVELSPILRSMHEYLDRCKSSIRQNICFNTERADEAKKRSLAILDNAIAALPFHQKQLTALRDLIDMAGFSGGLKEFVRQSSKVNSNLFDNFAQILDQYHPNIHNFMKNREYHELDSAEKADFHRMLRNDSDYFATLKKHASQFTLETLVELDRLEWFCKHRDIFTSYIVSDTIDIISLDEVVILFRFSDFMGNKLSIGDIGKSPVNLLPLCESPKDLTNLVPIITAMLENPHLRELIAKTRMLSYVAGPSDLGKVGGIFTLVQLVWSAKQVEDVLAQYKKIYAELNDVTLSVLYGLGGDSKRRSSRSDRQLHATFQGTDAHSLATAGAYVAYLANVVGGASDNTLRAKELQLLQENYPTYFECLQHVMHRSISGYQLFAEQISTKELLKKLTVPELGPRMNTSSRSDGKEKQPQDITKSRAIGLVNYQLMTGVLWDTFMGVEALIALEHTYRAQLPFLFEQSTVVQEIVYKVIYSIAVSDIPDAWKRLKPDATPTRSQIQQWAVEYADPKIAKQDRHALAHIDVSAQKILETLVSFLPLSHQECARASLQKNIAMQKSSHESALELLDAIGQTDGKFKRLANEIRLDLKPRFSRLRQNLDRYVANPTPGNMENTVLACRGDEKITAGPAEISKMTSRLMTVEPTLQARETAAGGFRLRARL